MLLERESPSTHPMLIQLAIGVGLLLRNVSQFLVYAYYSKSHMLFSWATQLSWVSE